MTNEDDQGATNAAESNDTAFTEADALKMIESMRSPQADLSDESEGDGHSDADSDEDGTEEKKEGDVDPAEKTEGKKKADEEKPKESDDEDLEPDPLLAELLKDNPKGLKRLTEMAKGVAKLKGERNTLRDEVSATSEKAKVLESYNAALEHAEYAPIALKQLIDYACSKLNKTPAELVGHLVGKTPDAEAALLPEIDAATGRKLPEWERRGFDSPKEMELDNELKALKQKVSLFDGERELLVKQRETTAKQAEFQKFVDGIADKTIKTIEKTESGWKVSPEMVTKAIREFPQLKDDPVRAVKAAFPDELVAHKLSASTSKTKGSRGPEMPADANGKGKQLPDPRNVKAKDLFELMNG
jgi:hypothetical protein